MHPQALPDDLDEALELLEASRGGGRSGWAAKCMRAYLHSSAPRSGPSRTVDEAEICRRYAEAY